MFEKRKNLNWRKILVTPKVFLKSKFHFLHFLHIFAILSSTRQEKQSNENCPRKLWFGKKNGQGQPGSPEGYDRTCYHQRCPRNQRDPEVQHLRKNTLPALPHQWMSYPMWNRVHLHSTCYHHLNYRDGAENPGILSFSIFLVLSVPIFAMSTKMFHIIMNE